MERKDKITILFAGDSGDGIQLTGSQFTNTAAIFGNDIGTLPNFPAEIRAPQGTVGGVSGFQLNFGSIEIFTPGDDCDVLVAMNAAALKANIAQLKDGGVLIANTNGFDSKNLRLANYEENPLEDSSLNSFQVSKIDVTKMTKLCLEESGLGNKVIERCKNMFVLGFVYWIFNRSMNDTISFLQQKFSAKEDIANANIKVLKAGYHFGETSETFTTQYEVAPSKMEPGEYRSIMGNQATALGLIAASKKTGLNLFYGSYPITPASDILHELAKHKNFGVKTFQAEDEIAAVCAAVGASFGGSLGVTASSGPGISLKSEGLGLAVMLEIPLVVINVQRGGPSTGLPTKTEQSDLMQAMYGRNGESPLPIVSASTPSDSFYAIMEACRIAIEHMTPVIFLSDGYIGNGSKPWKFPQEDELPSITPPFAKEGKGADYMPYKRDEKLVREWAIPGMKGFEHRVGGLEKEHITGNISYDSENHQLMTDLRKGKVERIAQSLPELKLESGPESGDLLVIGWGSTHGVIQNALRDYNHKVAHVHLRHINPLPKELGIIISKYKRVLIPEMNTGQLIKLIRGKYFIPSFGLNKVQGSPFTSLEITNKMDELLVL
ncbi:MAG: 2-oxoacid:acceptor oxidoreductase subunit alpha [Flavobacteriales bacterium]|nr:2-oxoacid:acceptor oxidoreductase subunit alpha [Flavobacteriales bacterium]